MARSYTINPDLPTRTYTVTQDGESRTFNAYSGVANVTATNVAAAGAAMKANNLSDLASASTARTNLSLGTTSNVNFKSLTLNATATGQPALSASTDGIAASGVYGYSENYTGGEFISANDIHLDAGGGKFIVANNGNTTLTGTLTASNYNPGTGVATFIATPTLANLNTALSDADVATLAGSETLTNKTIAAPIITNAAQFTSTTRPTSSGSGSPSSNSLITVTDGDARYLGLDSTEVSITGAVTLTSTAFSKIHVCSGTSADYTVGLPAASGNAGKTISFRMSSALTKLVTLDGNASETIDGATTRIMWANETAILFCDGTAWTKLAGKSIPMKARAALATAGAAVQSVATSTVVILNVTATEYDSTGTMSDLVNERLICRRAGTYTMFAAVVWDDGAGWAATRIIGRIRKNGTTDIAASEINKVSGGYPANTPATSATLALADYVEVTCFQNNASSRNLYGDSLCYISIQEIVSW